MAQDKGDKDEDSGAKAEPLVHNLWPETGRKLGLSRNGTYDAAKRGQIPTVSYGRLKKVPDWYYAKLRNG